MILNFKGGLYTHMKRNVTFILPVKPRFEPVIILTVFFFFGSTSLICDDKTFGICVRISSFKQTLNVES